MASPCNSLNVQTIKISNLSAINGRTATGNKIRPNDLFLLIQNGITDAPTSTNLYSRRATCKDLVTFMASVPSGSYSGSFSGSAKGHFTGSFTGSFKGYISASSHFNTKVAFHGTSSWAANATNALTANVATGCPTGTGLLNCATYWNGTNTLTYSNWTIYNLLAPNPGAAVGGNNGTGRINISRPLQMNQGAIFGMYGPHFIQYSRSYDMYDIGLQASSSYIRTGRNFAIFYSGSYASNATQQGGKDTLWTPDVAAKIGKSGWTVMGIRQRLFGIGHFPKSTLVDAQCHVHLSSSYGWPVGYNPNTNVWLVTSGSAMTKLARLSGSGQLDVAGDVIAASTFASSDERLKDEIFPIEDAYEKLEPLNPVSFVWDANRLPDFGLLAQDVEEIYPEFVREDMHGYKTVKYTSFIPLLIKTVQEQQQQITELTDRIAALESK
jgi:hypothetical protein